MKIIFMLLLCVSFASAQYFPATIATVTSSVSEVVYSSTSGGECTTTGDSLDVVIPDESNIGVLCSYTGAGNARPSSAPTIDWVPMVFVDSICHNAVNNYYTFTYSAVGLSAGTQKIRWTFDASTSGHAVAHVAYNVNQTTPVRTGQSRLQLWNGWGTSATVNLTSSTNDLIVWSGLLYGSPVSIIPTPDYSGSGGGRTSVSSHKTGTGSSESVSLSWTVDCEMYGLVYSFQAVQ